MKQVKLTQEQLAEIIGVSQASVQKYVSGKTQATNKILELARALECDPEWLATGSERLETRVLNVSESKADYSLTSSEIALLKIEGSCGVGSTIDCEPLHTARLIKEDNWFKKYKVRPKDTFAVYAKGDSMEMFIIEGDIVIFNKTKTQPVSGKIFLIRHPDGLKIKSLRQDITGNWLAESLNDKYPSEVIPKDMISQIVILGEFIYRQGG